MRRPVVVIVCGGFQALNLAPVVGGLFPMYVAIPSVAAEDIRLHLVPPAVGTER